MEWTPLSERIIQVRYYSKHIKLTIIHIYASTEDAHEHVKQEFYSRLHDVLDGRNTHKLIVTGDRNAKIGGPKPGLRKSERQAWTMSEEQRPFIEQS